MIEIWPLRTAWKSVPAPASCSGPAAPIHHHWRPCVPQEDPRGRQWWWIGAAGPEQDAGPGTDFHAVRTRHISITPIQVDLTRYHALEQVAGWVDGLIASLEHAAPASAAAGDMR